MVENVERLITEISAQCSTLTLARLSGASEIYPWTSKTTLRLARSGNQNFCSTDILRNDLICNEVSD